MRVHIAAAAAATVVALGAGIFVGRLTVDEGPARPAATVPGAVEPTRSASASSAAGTATPVGTPPSRDVTFTTSAARSLETTATFSGLAKVTLAGATLTFRDVEVEGRGRGTLVADASGGDVVTSGSALAFTPARAVLRPGATTIETSAFESTLRVPSAATLSAPRLLFTPASGATQQQIPSPARVRATGEDAVAEARGATQWKDRPRRVRITGATRTSLSWDGAGSITVGGRARTVAYGGVIGTAMTADIVESETRFGVTGKARARQVYFDGIPQLASRASVDLITPVQNATAGSRDSFTWAPRNLGGDFDVCITRISPTTDAARWANLRLAPLPTMAGGASKPKRGGDAPGFGGGVPLSSVIPPGDADRRDISFDVPSGTRAGTYVIGLRLEGNFPPVDVRIEIRVA